MNTQTPYPLGLKQRPVALREKFTAFKPEGEQLDPQRALSHHPEYSYQPFMPPIYDQGQHGLCVCFTMRAKMSFFSKKRLGHNIEISPRWLYWAIKQQYEGQDFTDDGSDPGDALKVLQKGYVLESDWPYNNGDGDLFAPVPDNLVKTDFLIKDFVSVPNDLNSVLMAMLQHGPLAVGGPWYQTWFNLPATNVQPIPSAGMNAVGGHERYWVGYSMSKRLICERNSWGLWADGGYSYVPFDLIGTDRAPDQIYTAQL